jgi:circadian clock protein KaiC
MEFLVRGRWSSTGGVLMSFEETADELAERRLHGIRRCGTCSAKKLLIDHVRVVRSEIEEIGAFDLEGLFIRLGLAVIRSARSAWCSIRWKPSSGVSPTRPFFVRNCIGSLNGSKRRGVTAVITGERGDGTLTRHGLEEYVSDCVILLDHRVINQLTARRLRIVKYRGTVHGTDEYPFLITANGVSVVPITSLTLDHIASREVVSTGVPTLDTILGAGGFYRASTIMFSGGSDTGKSGFRTDLSDVDENGEFPQHALDDEGTPLRPSLLGLGDIVIPGEHVGSDVQGG